MFVVEFYSNPTFNLIIGSISVIGLLQTDWLHFYLVSPAVPNAMHPGERMRMRSGSPSSAWPGSMAAQAPARLPHACISRDGESITRRSNACDARKGCRSQDATEPANTFMIIDMPSSACVPCIRTPSGVSTLSRTGCFGDAATGYRPSLMSTHCSIWETEVHPP